MTGQVLIGLAQPFVLAAPTRFSDQWFTDKGRTTATAIASLANPFGGAVSLRNFQPLGVDLIICLAWSVPRPYLGADELTEQSAHHGAVYCFNSTYPDSNT
jgi:hypothetical protein